MVAKRLIESGKPLMVSKTVMLELEWVMRGYYGFEPAEIAPVFADSLHHASYQVCNTIATFDDRKFSRRAVRLGLVPRVVGPK